jgi:signal peptidase I
MVPTLLIGDHVAVSKYSYGIWLPFLHKELVDLGDPERGDVIVFRYPRNPSLNYIKRVVGLPGDKIRVQNNKVVLNGTTQPLVYQDKYDFVDDKCRTRVMRRYEEDLAGLKHIALTSTGMGGLLSNKSEVEVPPDHVFVMGDNRDNSEDSREWGFVRYDQIKGKAHFVWLSWDGCNGSVGKVRGERFFHSLYE